MGRKYSRRLRKRKKSKVTDLVGLQQEGIAESVGGILEEQEQQKEKTIGEESQNPTTASKPTAQKKGNKTGMPDGVKSKMETAFQSDFSNVKMIPNSNKAFDIGAQAFAQGNEVHFAPGKFNPNTHEGQELIGHELAHINQQQEGRVQANSQLKGQPFNDQSNLEKEAEQSGKKAASASSVTKNPAKYRGGSKNKPSNTIQAATATIKPKIQSLLEDRANSLNTEKSGFINKLKPAFLDDISKIKKQVLKIAKSGDVDLEVLESLKKKITKFTTKKGTAEVNEQPLILILNLLQKIDNPDGAATASPEADHEAQDQTTTISQAPPALGDDLDEQVQEMHAQQAHANHESEQTEPPLTHKGLIDKREEVYDSQISDHIQEREKYRDPKNLQQGKAFRARRAPHNEEIKRLTGVKTTLPYIQEPDTTKPDSTDLPDKKTFDKRIKHLETKKQDIIKGERNLAEARSKRDHVEKLDKKIVALKSQRDILTSEEKTASLLDNFDQWLAPIAKTKGYEVLFSGYQALKPAEKIQVLRKAAPGFGDIDDIKIKLSTALGNFIGISELANLIDWEKLATAIRTVTNNQLLINRWSEFMAAKNSGNEEPDQELNSSGNAGLTPPSKLGRVKASERGAMGMMAPFSTAQSSKAADGLADRMAQMKDSGADASETGIAEVGQIGQAASLASVGIGSATAIMNIINAAKAYDASTHTAQFEKDLNFQLALIENLCNITEKTGKTLVTANTIETGKTAASLASEQGLESGMSAVGLALGGVFAIGTGLIKLFVGFRQAKGAEAKRKKLAELDEKLSEFSAKTTALKIAAERASAGQELKRNAAVGGMVVGGAMVAGGIVLLAAGPVGWTIVGAAATLGGIIAVYKIIQEKRDAVRFTDYILRLVIKNVASPSMDDKPLHEEERKGLLGSLGFADPQTFHHEFMSIISNYVADAAKNPEDENTHQFLHAIGLTAYDKEKGDIPSQKEIMTKIKAK
ncbi:MAG: DUF4157 domain-containing protein [Bacteroidota bacterium]